MNRSCCFDGCERTHYAKNYCHTHYVQLREGGETKPIKTKFVCIVQDCDVPHDSKGRHLFRSDEEKKEFKKRYDRAFRSLNKELVALRKKKAYEKNRPHYLKKAKEQRKTLDPKTAKRYRDNYKNSPGYKESKIRTTHKRRALKNNNGHTPYTVEGVLERWGTDCHICGEAVDLGAPRSARYKGWELGLNLDHVIPLSLGGEDALENVKPSHGMCNVKKGNKF
jgi:5-methylcytosine-specific restriction endonuclease McrA